MLQHAATSCNLLHHAATCCNMLQHAATYCTMLQYLCANAGRPAFGSSAQNSIYEYAMHMQGPMMMIASIITLGEIMY